MNKYLLLILLTMGNLTAQYRVFKKNDLNKIYENKISEIKEEYILETNNVFVTIFDDGTSILQPPILGGEKGFYFDNITTMYEMIKSGIYPIEGNGTFWEAEQPELKTLPNSIAYFESKLSKIINFEVRISDDNEYIGELSAIVTEYVKKQKKAKNFEYYLSIYIAELLRIKTNSVWILRPQAAFNIYDIPELKKENITCSPWVNIMGQIKMGSYIPINIEKMLNGINELYFKN